MENILHRNSHFKQGDAFFPGSSVKYINLFIN